MILPASLVRGEILHLRVVVFNYFDVDLINVTVILNKTNNFIQSSNNTINDDLVAKIARICKQSAETVEFLISPVNVGLLPLKVRALSSLAEDSESRKLKVKPEGIEQVSSQTLLLDLKNEQHAQSGF